MLFSTLGRLLCLTHDTPVSYLSIFPPRRHLPLPTVQQQHATTVLYITLHVTNTLLVV